MAEEEGGRGELHNGKRNRWTRERYPGRVIALMLSFQSRERERERERERQRDARRDKAPISARVIALREYLSDLSWKGRLVGIHQIDENDRRMCARARANAGIHLCCA